MIENKSLGPERSAEIALQVIIAYVAKNSVPVAELPLLIARVQAAVLGLSMGGDGEGATGQPTARGIEKPNPGQIRKSVQQDGIVSFLDGKTYKTLKRHLTSHGLDARSYRERYGLPADYPMVAPSYAAHRSTLAKAIGLGRLGARRGEEEPPQGVRSKPMGRRRA